MPANPDVRNTRPVPALAVLLVFLLACAADRPLVESFEQDSWHPEPLGLAALSGARDGIETSFTLILEGEGGRRLVLEGVVETDPQARLVSARWAEEGGAAPRSGVVSRSSIDFLGGQGGHPSLGGQFTLSAAGVPAYRVNLPSTRLAPPATDSRKQQEAPEENGDGKAL